MILNLGCGDRHEVQDCHYATRRRVDSPEQIGAIAILLAGTMSNAGSDLPESASAGVENAAEQ
jgi:hypothetical protein